MKSRKQAVGEPETRPGSDVVDQKRLSQLADLGRASGRDILTPLLHQFITNAASQLDQLALAVGKQDHARVQLIAHTLKGASANLGIKGIQLVAAELEDAAKNRTTGQDILLARLNAAVSTAGIWIDQNHPAAQA